jgi:hypothetical protein
VARSHSLAVKAAVSLVDLVPPCTMEMRRVSDIVPVALKLIEVVVGVDDEFSHVVP